MKKRNMGGFTLIELIVVIAIIAILAAIAGPRFISQITNARIAALNGAAGALNSTVELAQAEYIAEGNASTSTATSITMNGTTVIVDAGTGRPTGTAAGIGTALQTLGGFGVTYTPPIATFNFTTIVANCNVTYDDSTGIVAITSTGC